MFGHPVTYLDDANLERMLIHSNPNAQEEVLAYLDYIKNCPEGWKLCIGSLIKGNQSQDDRLKFFCFQVLEHYAKNSYCNATLEDQAMMREFISNWIQIQCLPNSRPQAVFMRNKAAQIFTLVFLQDYPQRWPTFFSDLTDTMSLGLPAIDNYCRVLKAIDSEIADQDVTHTTTEVERNSLLKTAVRETEVEKLTETWYQILTMYEGKNKAIVRLCLDVIGNFVYWINIEFIVNDRYVQLILRLLALPDVREGAANCLYNIMNKGMSPLDKVQLSESLFSVLMSSGYIEPIKDDETDFTCKLAQILNIVGVNLVVSHKRLLREGTLEQQQASYAAVERKIPLMIQYLANDYDDVSWVVTDFAREYMHMLKSKTLLTEDQIKWLESILVTITQKMKYDESYRFDDQGEDEATFLEYRKQLIVLFFNVVSLNEGLAFNFTEKYAMTVFGNWQNTPFQDVEVAMSLMYSLGEAVVGLHFVPVDSSEQTYMELPVMQRLMRTLVTSGISAHPHPVVGLQYLETCVRFDRYFAAEPSHLPALIVSFLGKQRGLYSPDCKVRSRAAFLFMRLVKLLKQQMCNYVDEVLFPLRDLLVLTINGSDDSQWVTRDDQLYLYEAAAVLIVASSKSAQEKGNDFRKLLRLILDKFGVVVNQLLVESDEDACQKMADYLCHLMAVTSRASKSFPNHNSMKACCCVPIFIDALQTFLTSLQISNSGLETVQAGVTQFLHRMVVCLEEDLLPYVPQSSHGLLKNSDISSIQGYLPLIIQIITKFKKEVMPLLQQVLVPIVSAILTSLAAPIEENDEQAKQEKQLLLRNYFNLICAVVCNDIVDVLRSHGGQFLEEVMMSTIRGAVDTSDPVAQKTCFAILRKIVSMWGEKGGPVEFTDFIYKQIVPACFLAPWKPTFDLSDPQYISALSESAMCIKSIHQQRGDELLNFLRNEYMPSLHVTPGVIDDYFLALCHSDKVFKGYARNFFIHVRK